MENTEYIIDQLTEILADLEDLSDEDLVLCRYTIQNRVKACLESIDTGEISW